MPKPGCIFPRDPVFAHAVEDEVMVWVTAGNRFPYGRLEEETFHMRSERGKDDPTTVALSALGESDQATLVYVKWLVHNRRKDGASIIFRPGDATLTVDPIVRTFCTAEIKPPLLDEGSAAKVSVFRNVRSHLCVDLLDINGKDAYVNFAPRSGHIVKLQPLTVSLAPSEFAIAQAFFRVGDGKTVVLAHQALHLCQSFHLPFFVTTTSKHGTSTLRQVISAKWDHAAVKSYFSDLIEKGEQEHILTRHGDIQASIARTQQNMVLLGKTVLESFNVEELSTGEGLRIRREHPVFDKIVDVILAKKMARGE
eukprot:TRINITY_DN3671_c0_g1_i6.p2 TRINITY_DN3671_c0_g1~~TRINITY_DN3671_c0_g1_i6.p2  ORF type:complete len:310 (+),score=36.79 TRINITY_DN3671_c0_g1_i6:1325-2254(+)